MALSRNASFLISLLFFLLTTFFQLSFQQLLCHEIERVALMQFKNSFLIRKYASEDPLAHPKTNFWKSQGIDCCLWEGIACDQHTGRVIHIDLESSYLFGSINSNSSLFRLDHLQYLNLADNDFHFSEIPPALGNLSRLTYLNLSKSLFSGQVPFEISKLSKLTILDLSWNINSSKLSESIDLPWEADYPTNQRLLELKTPHWKNLIQNLSRLEYLRLSFVNINSPIPSTLANLSSLAYLGLIQCGLFGKFPNAIFELPKLEKLVVPYNRGLTGVLPEFHSSNPLQKLDVSNTSFSGEFPKSLGLLNSLEYLDVASCNFLGILPSSLSNLTNLRVLGLSNNQISGSFPSWLTNLTQLTYLNLYDNMIQGIFPSSISRLKNLEFLRLSKNNLSGTVELDTFLRHKHLKYLFLSDNSLSLLTRNNNNISTNNTTIPKFVRLSLGACNLKEFPAAFLYNQDQLETLYLPDNKIHGQVPKWLLKMSPNLWFLDLSDNSLTSFEDSNSTFFPSSLVYLRLAFNFFKGFLPIPTPSISYYSVANNSFEGEIPPELFCNITTLKYLDLSRNNLSGMIPQCLGKSLTYLNLRENNLQGKLPRSLANCKNLEVLDLSSNQIIDTFPLWLGLLPHFKIIVLHSNGFYGTINGGSESNDDTLLFPELRIIDLSHNRFQGPLPLNYFLRWNVLPNSGHKEETYLDAYLEDIHSY